MKIYAADYVLPISAESIENGAIAIEKSRIVAVGLKSELAARFPEATMEDFGAAAILPGFVNCHSHLEITLMRGFLDDVEADFYSWLMKLTKTRAEHLTEEDIETGAILGALEGARAGVTCFGDIGRFGRAGFNALKTNHLRGVLFQETEFSPDDKTAHEDFYKLEEKFLTLKESETELVKIGLSPHAPYTVSRKLFETIAEYAISKNVKISTHAAESEMEADFFETGAGFFAGVYEKIGVDWRAPRISPIQYLHEIGVLKAKPLLAHCVRVSENDIDLIAASNSTIAHCPKSNAKFGHGFAPLEKFLERGATVGFGSDSVASNNTCDILEEARFATLFARNQTGATRFLQPREIIENATIGGAKSLGLENEIGTLEAGKQADFIIVSLENIRQMPVHDVYSALLFASNARDVRLTVVGGAEIYRDGVSLKIDERRLKAKIKEIARKM